MKCIVKDCTNRSHQGKFIGELCSPCYSFITTGEGMYSQAYRNTVLAEQAELCPLCGDGKLYEHTMYRCKGCGSELADARLMDKNKALAEQAEQEPVAWKDLTYGNLHHQDFGNSIPLYAAPVRTKDLTDEELWEAAKTAKSNDLTDAFRAVIAADREKNK